MKNFSKINSTTLTSRNKSKSLLFFSFLLLLILSCSSDKKSNNPLVLLALGGSSGSSSSSDDSGVGIGDDGSASLDFLDITDAETLYIGKGGDSNSKSSLLVNKAEQESEKLFKITDKGEVLEVVYKDENQQEITNFGTPTKFFKMSDKYLLFEFEKDRYLVNKTNGKVYEFGEEKDKENNQKPTFPSSLYLIDKAESIKTDSAGNIYYQSVSGEEVNLVKLNVQDPENLTVKNLLPKNHNMVGVNSDYPFSVDKNGNLAYIATETNTKQKVSMYLYQLVKRNLFL